MVQDPQINIIHFINNLKIKIMIISIEEWQKLNIVGIERTYLNLIRPYDKSIADIILDEKLRAFPLRSGIRKGCSL